jgi:hypothetical protein
VSHVPRFSFFSPYSRSYTVHFSFSTLMSGSCHISGQAVFVYHFPFFISGFSPRSMSYQVIFSFPELVSFLAIFQVLQSAFLIFHVFQCFSPYSISYDVCVSFFTFFNFLPIIQTYSAYFTFFTLSVFLSIFQLYNVCDSFSTVFFLCLFFHHIPGPTVCISHFLCFSMFLFHISCSKVCVSQFPRFSIFSPNSNPKVSISHFSHSSLFFAKFQFLQCVFLIVNVIQCFSPYSRLYNVYFLFFHVFHCFSPYSII